jgi:colicin import membrane protein
MTSSKLIVLAAALVFWGGFQAAPATAQENKPAFSGTPAGQGGRSAEAQERAREMGQKNGQAAEKLGQGSDKEKAAKAEKVKAEKAKADKAKAAKAKADKTKANKKS